MLDNSAKVESRKLLIAELLRGSSVCVAVNTTSMIPTILPGDIATVSPVQSRNLRLHDIVLLELDEEWIIHRIVEIDRRNEHAVTRGDHAISADTPTPFPRILGKVTEVRRKGRAMPLRLRSALARLARRLAKKVFT